MLKVPVHHHPLYWCGVAQHLGARILQRAGAWNCDQIGKGTRLDTAEFALLFDGFCRRGCDGFKQRVRVHRRVGLRESAKFLEQAQGVGARKAVGADRDVCPEFLEAVELECSVTKVSVASRAVDDVREGVGWKRR